MYINIPAGSLGLFVNATPTRDNDAVALSQFNLTSPAGTRPVVIRITPPTTHTLVRTLTLTPIPTLSPTRAPHPATFLAAKINYSLNNVSLL